MKLLSSLLILAPLAACTNNADSSVISSNALDETVPQAQLISCVDGGVRKGTLTVTDDIDVTWDVLGAHGTSRLIGAGFTWESSTSPTDFNIELADGKQIDVKGFFEDVKLVSMTTSEGTIACGEGSAQQNYNIRTMIDATNTSFKERKLFARCTFDGSADPVEIIVRPALRGLGAIFEGRAPKVGSFFFSSSSFTDTAFAGQGATGGEHAAGAPTTIVQFGQLSIAHDAATGVDSLVSDAPGDRAFPANKCTLAGVDYAKTLITSGVPANGPPSAVGTK